MTHLVFDADLPLQVALWPCICISGVHGCYVEKIAAVVRITLVSQKILVTRIKNMQHLLLVQRTKGVRENTNRKREKKVKSFPRVFLGDG